MTDHLLSLRAGGVSVLLDLRDGGLPVIVHWGADLGPMTEADVAAAADAAVMPRVTNRQDAPIRLSLLPEEWTGWVGVPGLSGSRDGKAWAPRFTVDEVLVDGTTLDTRFVETGAAAIEVRATDDDTALGLTLELELLASGLLRSRATVVNRDDTTYAVGGIRLAYPVPDRATELADFAGHWGLERVPQRAPFDIGRRERENRRGRTGMDSALVLSAGESGFGFGAGEVWGVHVGFSGGSIHSAERLASGERVLSGGESLLSGEVRLGREESYTSPWLYGAWGRGQDDQAVRIHEWMRAREGYPARPRPVTLNVWEAVYFNHDLDVLTRLAERAAAAGIERYVLDDGWFHARRRDVAGLGDWVVDRDVWPDGLSPLIERVRGLGMEFGLWFEPEMVNPDSDLYRAHPEWVLQVPGRLPVVSRTQQVLDLAHPEAYAHVLGQMSALLEEYDIAYIKWDHNRDLVDAGHTPAGEPGVHRQTRAAYRLMAELKGRFPGLEIEACASGGARVDLGVMEIADRVWGSDNIDPHDRQSIDRYTMQLLPPELIGSHIASPVSHTTGRATALSFRAGTALRAHLGVEWDLTSASDADLAELREWIALHKRWRPVLHGGRVVRVDSAVGELVVAGTVATDRRSALFTIAALDQSIVAPRGRLTLPGLDPAVRYRVSPVRIGAVRGSMPAWAAEDAETVLPGSVLAGPGIAWPELSPDNALVVELTAVD